MPLGFDVKKFFKKEEGRSMIEIKIPRKAIVLIIGPTCSGKSRLAKKIVDEAQTPDAKIISHDTMLKDYLLQTGLIHEYSVACTDRIGFLNTGKIPGPKLEQFLRTRDAQMMESARRSDLLIVDSDYAYVEQVKGVIRALDLLRNDKHLVLIKLAPDQNIYEQLKKARYQEFGKKAPNSTKLTSDAMMTMASKSDYEQLLWVTKFTYGAPPPERFLEYLVENPFTVKLRLA